MCIFYKETQITLVRIHNTVFFRNKILVSVCSSCSVFLPARVNAENPKAQLTGAPTPVHHPYLFVSPQKERCQLEVSYDITVFLVLLFSHSVVSDCLQPHGLQPSRLLCPQGSPGKNTGGGCHSSLQDQGSNLCLLHWLADSLPLSHLGSPVKLADSS